MQEQRRTIMSRITNESIATKHEIRTQKHEYKDKIARWTRCTIGH